MGSIISKCRKNNNKVICDSLIENFINMFQEYNIGINIYIGKNGKMKKYKYTFQKYPKYYIIIQLPYGINTNFNIINSGNIILNGNEKMAMIAFNKFQSISKIYKPMSEFYEIMNISLMHNMYLVEQIKLILNKIKTLEIHHN
jgi:hypothetical protein